MKFLLSSVFLFFIGQFVAQNDTLEWNENVCGNQMWLQAPTGETLLFTGRIAIEKKREHVQKSLQIHYHATAQWLVNESYLLADRKTELTILAQLYFDCYEYQSRLCFQAINREREVDFQVQQAKNDAESKAQIMIAQIKQETENGANAEALEKWRSKLNMMLSITPRITIPDFETERFSLGFDMGYAFTSLNGTVSQLFTSKGGFAYGATLITKRVFIDAHSSTEIVDPKLNYSKKDFYFTDSTRTRLKQVQFVIGWNIVNTKRFSCSPYIGISSFRILNYTEPKGSILRNGPGYLQPIAGVVSEYRFDQVIQTNSVVGYWKVMLKAGLGKVQYGSEYGGMTFLVNLGIGYSLQGIRNTWQD